MDTEDPFSFLGLKRVVTSLGAPFFFFSSFFSHQNRGNGNAANISLFSEPRVRFSAFYVADGILLMVYKTQLSNLPSVLSDSEYQKSSKSMMGSTLPNSI